MCILCVIQKWSRRIATMLPWLVIPLIGLWALSQLLPPAFRFEITSPRLACVFVLLVTLFWYEILMPQLSAWRVRRNARLRERKRFEAIEMQKLRRTATRRCRNCLTPYRDQNPGGGRFMCSYCGHNSKRPVLDLPVPPGFGLSNSGILKDLVGRGGNILNGKVWSDNSWMCGQDWLDNGNWGSGSFAGKSSYWRKNGVGFFSSDSNHCMAEKSYSRVVIFSCKISTTFFLSIGWLWRKITRVSSSRDDASSYTEHKGMLANRGENVENSQESKGEKARRKAEEKRQARLERELLEEEERKQREEVARLVEERRRLRGEKMEVEKDRGRGLTTAREKDSKKETEKKRQDRRKEKDKGSSKSNSDAEELEKRTGKETELKREFDRKSETDRWEHHRTNADSVKNQGTELTHGVKASSPKSNSRGNAGRYLDRMRGTFLSSSKAFSGGSFFLKGVNASATVSRENKPSVSVDHVHAFANTRELSQPGKSITNGDDKTINRPVLIEPQPTAVPKKSWQQLFTRSSTIPPATNSNVISRPNGKSQAGAQNPPFAGHSSSGPLYDNPINFGLPSPFTLPTFPSISSSSKTVPPLTSEAMFPRIGEAPRDSLPEESDIFEDPCYDPCYDLHTPDPVFLLGPVTESLNNFQLNIGSGFTEDMGLDKPHALKKISTGEVNRPSPIESPMSRVRISDERSSNSNLFPSTPKAHDRPTSPMDDSSSANGNGTYQMWSTSPLGQDGIGLVGSPASWLLPPELNRSNVDDLLHPMSQKTMASLFTKDDQTLSRSVSPRKVFLGNYQNGGTLATSVPGPTPDPWLPKSLFGPMPGSEGHFSFNPLEEISRNEMMYGSPTSSATNHPCDVSPANCWAK
ncbi:hypothetical protein U1Q18_043545 [Sarracenia purpurea var. burkii]